MLTKLDNRIKRARVRSPCKGTIVLDSVPYVCCGSYVGGGWQNKYTLGRL